MERFLEGLTSYEIMMRMDLHCMRNMVRRHCMAPKVQIRYDSIRGVYRATDSFSVVCIAHYFTVTYSCSSDSHTTSHRLWDARLSALEQPEDHCRRSEAGNCRGLFGVGLVACALSHVYVYVMCGPSLAPAAR